MYLVDTSVWINHLRKADRALIAALEQGLVVMHPHVVGELALGSLKDRGRVIEDLDALRVVRCADDDEVRHMIETQKLFSCGIGYTDAHLLASALIDGDAWLWTADKRLDAVANELGVSGRFLD